MVPDVPCIELGNWGRERDFARSSVTECGVLRRKFWQESHLIRSSHIQRCRWFSERVGPRVILLESQPGKQSSRSEQLGRLRYEFKL